MTIAIMQRIDADLNVTNDIDPEVKQRWLTLSIAMGYMPAFEQAHEFVSVQGRMKYINPIYQALIRNGYRSFAY
jgi:leukotriene-A4 hydrolase